MFQIAAPRRGLFVCVFLFLCAAPPCFSGPALIIDADAQFEFAEKYFVQGQYYRAISEYQRFSHFFPNDSRAALAMYKTGQAYFNGEQFKDAQKFFENVISGFPETSQAGNARLMICQCYTALNDFEAALACLSPLASNPDEPEIANQASYRAGWIYIQASQWDGALKAFSDISPDAGESFNVPDIILALDKAASLKQKEPVLAGFLSVVPGLGQAYTGRYQDAAIAFLLNFGLAFAAYECFDNDQEALGSVLGVVGFGFYAGNIYGAVSSAQKYNKSQKAGFIRHLKELKISAGPLPGKKGMIALLTINF